MFGFDCLIVTIFVRPMFFWFYRQAYDNCVVLEARICYNVAKLMSLNAER